MLRLGHAQQGTGPCNVVLVVLDVLDVLVVGGMVVLEFRSSGHTFGAGAFFRLSSVGSFVVSSPPKMAQYCFESAPTVSTMPTWPVNGVGNVTPVPLQSAFTTFAFTRTTRHGSLAEPSPRYL